MALFTVPAFLLWRLELQRKPKEGWGLLRKPTVMLKNLPASSWEAWSSSAKDHLHLPYWTHQQQTPLCLYPRPKPHKLLSLCYNFLHLPLMFALMVSLWLFPGPSVSPFCHQPFTSSHLQLFWFQSCHCLPPSLLINLNPHCHLSGTTNTCLCHP